ncbi:MAG TPA: protein kinase [Thermoguttaceae bacterium]|nr:protein kinase [Thermoguttaceae bacterium]
MNSERLGPYRLGRRLGRGGMGAVYEGVNEETGERVAVKVLGAQFSGEADFRDRFASEIETLHRLRHPNIVRLFGFGQQDDQLFYAMELVDGVSLEEELQQGRRFQWPEVLRIAQQTCDALRHAHDRGVIHRDIKPANLLLAADESVKLSDFGIAKLFGQGRMTTVGSVIGTVEYMAPEQADARPVDARADLYSLGGVLYALLAGRAPLVAASLPEMLHKQRHEMPTPLERVVPGVPREFSELIQQLLEKQPERRVVDARMLARRLDAIGTGLAQRMLDAAALVSGGAVEPSEAKNGLDFVPPAPGASDALGLMPTRAMDDEDAEAVSPPPAPNFPRVPRAAPLPETLATAAFQLAEPAGSSGEASKKPEEPPVASEPVVHFTPVAEHELDQAPEDEASRHPLISMQTWALVIGLLAVGLTIWYFLLPPSADRLFERIKRRTADGDIESIKAEEDHIEFFLTQYANDSRAKRLRKLQDEIALDRLENRFNLQVRRLQEADGLLPVQRAYLEARNYLWLDPERGVAKLEAILDLYGQEADMSGPTGQCIELARRRLEKLREEKPTIDAEYLELIRSRLETADELKQSDPQRAGEMYEAIVELYGAKPWAADAVRKAREALHELDIQTDGRK